MTVDAVAIIGAGTMGRGIAQTFLQHGYAITLIDQTEDQLEAAVETIRGRIDNGESEDTTGDLTITTDMDAVADVDLILEAVPEDIEIKADVFTAAAEHNTDAIYASNTSSIPIAKLAEHAPDAARCVGMHFFNPAPVMDIIELVVTDTTDASVVETVRGIAETLDKEVSMVRDVPGIDSNRILIPYINEAIKTLEHEIAEKEAIDRIAKKGFNHPMGPLELADFIGLDVCLDIMERMHEETGEDRFRPADLLEERVWDGKLGKKSGEGFYEYD